MDLDAQLSLEDQIVVAIRRIVRAIELHSKSLVATVGLTSPQVAVMKTVAAMGEVTPTALARTLKLSQPTVSGIVDRLAQRGLVERVAVDGDKRKHAVRLTSEGRRAISAVPSLLQERFRVELERLESWEQTMLLSSLQRIAVLMDAEGVTATPFLTPGAATAGADVSDGALPPISIVNGAARKLAPEEPAKDLGGTRA